VAILEKSVRPRDFKPCLPTYEAILPLNTIAVNTPRGQLQCSSDHMRCYCCDVSLFSLPVVQLLSVIAIAVVAIGGFGQRFSPIHLLDRCMCYSRTRQAFSGLRDLLSPKGDKRVMIQYSERELHSVHVIFPGNTFL